MSSPIQSSGPSNISGPTDLESKTNAPKTKFAFSIKQADSNKNVSKAMEKQSNIPAEKPNIPTDS
ncbi:MAG: hypothetical protein LBH49_02660 [Puniceicoccales bacterium]|jgi:hypothetical protein|nr:hypothetical protein [Puniceicoccales bacterium]